jgi:pimeloyl-ACP methyl ester carboxylesterase
VQLELVSITTDSYPLDGLFYQPAGGASAGAVLLMHGNCFNFYTGIMRFLPPALAQLGYACLAYNRRGHDVIATLNSREPVGGAYQRVSQAIADNRHAAAWLAERGFAAPIVIGHSNGGVLGVRHVADHPATPALVLLSAHRGGKDLARIASKAGLLAGDRYDEIVAQARELIVAGRGNELILLPGWYYVITAATFVDHVNELPDVVALAPRIRCPVLYVRGDGELQTLYPAEEFAPTAGGRCEVRIVSDCDHFYGGREEAICDLVGSWLQQALAKGDGHANAIERP